MNAATKATLLTGAGVLGGALAGFFVVRHVVRSRCKTQVRGACKKVPLVTDRACDTMAERICIGDDAGKAKSVLTAGPLGHGATEPRGFRRRRGRPVSRASAMAGTIGGSR